MELPECVSETSQRDLPHAAAEQSIQAGRVGGADLLEHLAEQEATWSAENRVGGRPIGRPPTDAVERYRYAAR